MFDIHGDEDLLEKAKQAKAAQALLMPGGLDNLGNPSTVVPQDNAMETITRLLTQKTPIQEPEQPKLPLQQLQSPTSEPVVEGDQKNVPMESDLKKVPAQKVAPKESAASEDSDTEEEAKPKQSKSDALYKQMQQSREIANHYLIQSMTGTPQVAAAMKAMASNELGKADDLKEAIIQSRMEEKHGQEIRTLRAQADDAESKADPDSDISKFARGIIGQMGGKIGMKMNIGDTTSASDLEKMFGPIERYMSFVEGKMLQNERMDLARQEKEEKVTNTRFDNLNKMLSAEIARKNTSFGQNADIVQRADAIQALVADTQNLNKLTPNQVAEIAKSLDTMISRGSSTVSGVKTLMPSTIAGDKAKIQAYITNQLSGANQGQFVKQLLDTVGRERQTAVNNIKKTKKSLLGSSRDLAEKNPGKWADLMGAHGLPSDILDGEAEELPSNSAPNLNVDQDKVMAELRRRGLK